MTFLLLVLLLLAPLLTEGLASEKICTVPLSLEQARYVVCVVVTKGDDIESVSRQTLATSTVQLLYICTRGCVSMHYLGECRCVVIPGVRNKGSKYLLCPFPVETPVTDPRYGNPTDESTSPSRTPMRVGTRRGSKKFGPNPHHVL